MSVDTRAAMRRQLVRPRPSRRRVLRSRTSPRAQARSTGTTILLWLTWVAAATALGEVIVLGLMANIPLWPATSGILTWIGLWLTLVLVRRSSEGSHPRHISPVVMFAGVYFLTGALGPALWLATPLNPPGATAQSSAALGYVVITAISYAVAVPVATLGTSGARPRTRGSHVSQALSRRLSATRTRAEAARARATSARVPGATVLIVLGMAGMVIRFPSLDSFTGYFSADYEEIARRAEGPIGYLGSVLRPLLPAGLFVLWINRRNVLRGSVLLVTTIVTMGSFSLNRGYVLVPLVAFGVAYHTKVRRIPTGVMVAGVVALSAAFVFTGALRTTTLNSQGGQFDVANPLEAGIFTATAQSVQLYAQTPVQTGVVVEAERPESRNDLSSVLAPLPGVSEELREQTGTREYNRIIYGESTPSDQILPSHLEAWWVAGFAGVLGWSVLVGVTMRYLNRKMIESTALPPALALSVAALWVAQLQIISVTVLVQVLLYMGPAAVTLVALTRRLNIR